MRALGGGFTERVCGDAGRLGDSHPGSRNHSSTDSVTTGLQPPGGTSALSLHLMVITLRASGVSLYRTVPETLLRPGTSCFTWSTASSLVDHTA